MAALLIFLSALLALFLVLLWLPLVLEISTRERRYLLRYGPLLQVRALPDPKHWFRLQCTLLFWTFQWSPLETQGRRKAMRWRKRPRPSRSKKHKLSLSKARRLLQTFRIREFRWEMDTGNPVLNAKLYPAWYLAQFWCRAPQVNFEGRNSLLLRMDNRPIRLLTAWIHP